MAKDREDINASAETESARQADVKEAIQSGIEENADIEKISRRAFSESLRKEYKPRRRRRLAITLLVLIVALGAVGGLVYAATLFKPPVAEIPDTTVSLTDYTTDEIESVTITPREGEAFSVAYDAASGSYRVIGWEAGIPTNQTSIRDIYTSARALTASKTIEENVQNLAEYGFDNPTASVSIHHVNGQTFEFELGSRVISGTDWYLRRANDNTVYSVSGTVGTRFSYLSKNLRDLNVLSSVSLDYVNYVYLERTGQPTIELRQGTSDITYTSWLFVQPNDIDASEEAITALCESISALSFASFIETTSDPSQFGFDEPAAVIMMKDSDGNSIHLEIGGAATETSAYARIANSSDIYTISNTKLAFLQETTLTQLVNKFFAIINIGVVDEVDISFAGGSSSRIQIDREPELDADGKQKTAGDGTPSFTDRFYVDGVEMDDSPFRKVYQEIIGLMFRGVVDGEISQTPAATIDFLFNNERERLNIAFYAYGRDFYAVSRDGSEPLFFARKDDVDSILDKINFLKALPTIRDADMVSAITLIRDGEEAVLNRSFTNAEQVENVYKSILTASASGMTSEKFTGDPKLAFRFDYADGRESVTLEYHVYQGGFLAYGLPGSNTRLYTASTTIDSRIESFLKAIG